MHPTIIQSIAADHARDIQQGVKHSHDVSVARDRRQRQRRALRPAGTGRLMPARLRLRMS